MTDDDVVEEAKQLLAGVECKDCVNFIDISKNGFMIHRCVRNLQKTEVGCEKYERRRRYYS